MKKKKLIIYIIVFVIFIILLNMVSNIFKSHHKVSYTIDKNKEIKVVEEYVKHKNDDYYLLEIKIKDKVFLFDIDNYFGKKKKIISDVIFYEKDNLMCIYPKLIDDRYLDIECNIDNKLYSFNSIKDKYDVKDFINKIPGYDDNLYKDKVDDIDKEKDILIYKDNILNGENILIYNYKNLVKINNKEKRNISFSDFDIYNNELGILVDHFYLIPKYTKNAEIKNYYLIDILNNQKSEIKLKDKLSMSTYVNGIVDNKLYIFDKSNIIQYEINPKKKKVTKFGNKNNMKFYDGKWVDANPYDYVKTKKTFNYIDSEEKLPFDYEKIMVSNNSYYYYDKDGNFYKVYKNNLNSSIFLFKYDNFHEVKLINSNIYFIHEDILYRYNNNGVKSILKRNEFKYNYKNIYSVYSN